MKRISSWCTQHKGATLGIIVALVLIMMPVTYVGVEATSTVSFCKSCHEMEPAYESYLQSSHYKVEDESMRATCRDCHVPPWNKPIAVLWTKAYHGTKDVAKHFLDSDDLMTPGYQEHMAAKAPHGIPNSGCLKCHDDVFTEQYEGRENIHALIRKNRSMKCAKCHKGLVHQGSI